jgi:septal ring factor EnvC (AmiA/AmiB activator)
MGWNNPVDLQTFQRLERDVEKLFEQLRRAAERQAQLSTALGKSREEIERLRADIQRYKTERSDTRRKVDALLREFESLDLRLEGAEA